MSSKKAIFVISLAMLAGCQTTVERDKEDINIIKTQWPGKNIQIAINAFGNNYTEETSAKRIHAYQWSTVGEVPVTFIKHASADESCDLRIIANDSNRIIGFSIYGQDGSCRRLLRNVGDATDSFDSKSASH